MGPPSPPLPSNSIRLGIGFIEIVFRIASRVLVIAFIAVMSYRVIHPSTYIIFIRVSPKLIPYGCELFFRGGNPEPPEGGRGVERRLPEVAHSS